MFPQLVIFVLNILTGLLHYFLVLLFAARLCCRRMQPTLHVGSSRHNRFFAALLSLHCHILFSVLSDLSAAALHNILSATFFE